MDIKSLHKQPRQFFKGSLHPIIRHYIEDSRRGFVILVYQTVKSLYFNPSHNITRTKRKVSQEWILNTNKTINPVHKLGFCKKGYSGASQIWFLSVFRTRNEIRITRPALDHVVSQEELWLGSRGMQEFQVLFLMR
jgi:hypothetical protein